MAVRGLPEQHKRPAIYAGIGLGAVLRIGLALIAIEILRYPIVSFLGALALIWICWGIAKDLLKKDTHEDTLPSTGNLLDAILKIVIADLSMSIDNVIGVAGAAEGHPVILTVGLAFSVLVMAVGAELIAKLLDRHPWLGWGALVLIANIAIQLLWHSVPELMNYFI
ncbi:membrane protein [Lasius niger]|uniref:Membrane protein n=1 Tax=Lasius niger TaxID=67767 RepID=A0A0J7KDG4_LASNI|nr:membrane protein [Lasius niger]